MWTFFKKSISRASDPGPKLTFCHHLPVAGDVIKFTGKNIFYQTWNTLCKNRQSLLLPWLNIFTMFLIFPLLTKKQQQRDLLIYIFFFVPKKRWDSCSLHVFWQTEQAIVLCLFHTYSVCSLMWAYIFCTHGNGLEQGYSISFIWGLDYRIENLLSYWTLYGHLRLFN